MNNNIIDGENQALVDSFNAFFSGSCKIRPETLSDIIHGIKENNSKLCEISDVYLKGVLDVLKKQSFRRTECYMLFFLLESMMDENDCTSIVFLDREFYMIKSITVGKKTLLNFEALVTFIECEGEKCKAEYAIIFRKIEEGDFKSEFLRADSVFCMLKNVKLYDYVLKSGKMFRSIMAAFR